MMTNFRTLLTASTFALLAACGGATESESALDAAASNSTSSQDPWNVHYTLPAGFKVANEQGPLTVLTSDQQGGFIVVQRSVFRNTQEALMAVQGFLAAAGVSGLGGQPEQVTIAGLSGVSFVSDGYAQTGDALKFRYTGVLSSFGTGLGVLVVAYPQTFSTFEQAGQALLGSAQIGQPQINTAAVSGLAGTWVYWSGRSTPSSSVQSGSSNQYEERIVFDGASKFQLTRESSVSVTVREGSAGGASGSADSGDYTVIGSDLVLLSAQGPYVVRMQMNGNTVIVDGKTYYRG